MGYQISRLQGRARAGGEEAAALEMIRTYPRKLRRRLNPSKNLGFRYEYNTLLHLAALRGMPNLLRVLLEEYSSDTNWWSDDMDTPLYVPGARANDVATNSLDRHTCLKFMVGWRGRTNHGKDDKINLTAKNTAGDPDLHLAAADGLIGGVEEVIKAGVSPFVVDNDSLIPHGLAGVLGYYCTAFMLDVIMNFEKDVQDEERSNLRMSEDDEACFSFDFKTISNLIDGDFKNMTTLRTVDQALEKSNIGKTSLITEYYRERLTVKWTSDLVECFKLAGIAISPPPINPAAMAAVDEDGNPPVDERRVVCPICMTVVRVSSRPAVQMKCGHNFCTSCWQTYLTTKIDHECQYSILCPIYNCKIVIPNHIVERLVGPTVIRKYRSLKLMTFINTSNFIKWCPVSDCGLAVRLSVPRYWRKAYAPLQQIGLMPSRAVECGNGHYFCWECLDTCHAPMPCDQWQMWLERARDHDPGAVPKKIKDCAEAVNHLWIMEFSKMCPMCHAPTEENDGCKYMSCTECEYEFRYICLGVCEIKPTLIGGLVECVTPNDYPSSPRSGYTSSTVYGESSDEDEDPRSGRNSPVRHEEGADDEDEEPRSGRNSPDRDEEGAVEDEGPRSGRIRFVGDEETADDEDEGPRSGRISPSAPEEGADEDEGPRSGHISPNAHEECSDDEDEGPKSGHISPNAHEECSDDENEGPRGGRFSPMKYEEGANEDEGPRRGRISPVRNEEGADDEGSRSEANGCTRHKECSDLNQALTDGLRCFSRCSEISDVTVRERGRYILIVHKEFSDVDDVLRGRNYTFNKNEEGYEMIDKLRDRYFECTRREEPYDGDDAEDKLWEEATMRIQERQGLKKFNDYYMKYMEMTKLLQREKYYYKVMCERVECIKRELKQKKDSPEKGKEKAQFLLDGMLELLKLRETLASSYAYAFYLDEMGFNTENLRNQQDELDDLIKKLIDVILMPQNREQSELPPRSAVTNLTVTSRKTRYRFMRVIVNSLFRQDVFSVIKKEKKKLAKRRNYDSEGEDNMEESHYPFVSSAGASKPADTIDVGNLFKNFNYSWFDLSVRSNCKSDETLSESGIGPCKARRYRGSGVRNGEGQKVNSNCPKCMPNDTQRPALNMRPWKSAENLENIMHATEEKMEEGNMSSLSSEARALQDANASGATALSMQQQKTDVGVTIGNVIQEADAEKSAHHSIVTQDVEYERALNYWFENNFQGGSEAVENPFSHDTEGIIGEQVNSLTFNQIDDESCGYSGGFEASFFPGDPEKQLVGDPETNTHLNLDFEKEEATEQSPKPTENPGEAANRPLNYIKTEAKITFLTESSLFGEVLESKTCKIQMDADEFMDLSRGLEKELSKPSSARILLDEAASTSTFFKQEDYSEEASSSQASQVKAKGNDFPKYGPEMMSAGKPDDEEMMVLDGQETDFRSAAESLKSKDQGPRPFPTKKEDFFPPQPVRNDYNVKKEHKKPSASDSGEHAMKKHSLYSDDSSYDYESITGLPKSPNLCISGVFITRTPESGHISRKDAQMLQSASSTSGRYYSSPKVQEALERYRATGRMFDNVGGSDRSSSSSGNRYPGMYTTSYLDKNTCLFHRSITPPRYSFSIRDDSKANRLPCSFDKTTCRPVKDAQMEMAREGGKCDGTSEPVERLMFPLHKSPTEGALSSVVYVNENYSSEDDFHEVLFLLGRSHRDPSKRKKKRERERKMEFSYKEDHDDFSSAL